MVSRGLGRFRVASAKKRELPNTPLPLPLPHPATPINLPTSRTKSLSHRSSAGDLAPASKPSGLDQALKLIHPRTSTISKAKLKLAPSGAIVFTPAQSQESLGSSILPGKAFLLCMSIQERLISEQCRESGFTTYKLKYCKASVNACPGSGESL